MTKAQIRKNVFLKSIPIMCSYIFVSMAYGIMMENAGFGWYYSLFVSLAFPKGIAAVRSVEMDLPLTRCTDYAMICTDTCAFFI